MALDSYLYRDPMLIVQEKQERELKRKQAPARLREDPFGNIMRGATVIMTREENDEIEDLLMVWYYWARADRPQLGHSRTSPGFELVERSDVYVDSDDIDARVNAYDAEQVDVCINELPLMMRAAIGVHTANKAEGKAASRNSRTTPEAQHRQYQEAKVRLLPMLRGRGLLRVTTSMGFSRRA